MKMEMERAQLEWEMAVAAKAYAQIQCAHVEQRCRPSEEFLDRGVHQAAILDDAPPLIGELGERHRPVAQCGPSGLVAAEDQDLEHVAVFHRGESFAVLFGLDLKGTDDFDLRIHYAGVLMIVECEKLPPSATSCP